MQTFLENKFTVPILIFIISLAIFSFNLEGQGIAIDEWFHHGFSMTFFDLTKEGNVLDTCITLNGDCDKIDLECPGPIHRIGSGGILKGILVGLGDYLFSDNERIYYTSTDITCRPIHKDIHQPGINIPTSEELGAGRFFTPIFSSLTLVVSYLLGKQLFNRNVGLMFALILLFHTLWFHFSRTILSEVYVSFFVLLSIYLVVYSSRKNKFDYKYCILSAIVFGLAVNTKFTALLILPLIFLIIAFKDSWNMPLTLKNTKKIFSPKIFLIIIIYSGILYVTMIGTFPYYWEDPLEQTFLQIDAITNDNYRAVTIDLNKKILLPFVESVTIAPIIDGYYYLFLPDDVPQSAQIGHTFSSIPLSLFFLLGIFWIFKKIIKKQITYSEMLIFGWYIVTYVTVSIFTESYNASRHFLPVIFPMILIMAYGLQNFLHSFKESLQRFFWIITLFSHSITFLIFWKIIYFDPDLVWNLPSTVNLRLSFSEPIVMCSAVLFLIVFSIYCLKRRRL